jgi:hypothetical protein
MLELYEMVMNFGLTENICTLHALIFELRSHNYLIYVK